MTNETPLHIRQAEGLRRLADMIEEHPDLAEVLTYSLQFNTFSNDPAVLAKFLKVGRRYGATTEKATSGEKWFMARLIWGDGYTAVQLDVNAHREAVCERVVTGTEMATKTVLDPAKLAEVPTVEVTERVETVEWRCAPLLAAEKTPAVTR